jgi:hypothetical protein
MVEARLAIPFPTTSEIRKARREGAKYAKEAAIEKIQSAQEGTGQPAAMKDRRLDRLTQMPSELLTSSQEHEQNGDFPVRKKRRR